MSLIGRVYQSERDFFMYIAVWPIVCVKGGGAVWSSPKNP